MIQQGAGFLRSNIGAFSSHNANDCCGRFSARRNQIPPEKPILREICRLPGMQPPVLTIFPSVLKVIQKCSAILRQAYAPVTYACTVAVSLAAPEKGYCVPDLQQTLPGERRATRCRCFAPDGAVVIKFESATTHSPVSIRLSLIGRRAGDRTCRMLVLLR